MNEYNSCMQKTIHSAEYQRLLEWLRLRRFDSGLTMRELGELLHVPHSWIGKVEQGERRLDLVEFIMVCSALNCDPQEGLKVITSSEKYSLPNKQEPSVKS